LAQIRRLEGFGTLSYLQRKNDISSVGINAKDDLTSTQLNSIGLAYPVPTYQGSLVFGIGYHRVHPYDASLKFRLVNATPNDADQSWSILEEGGLNNWVFAGAVEVAPNISLGAALNIFTGNNDYTSRFTEVDNVGDRIPDFSEARFEDVVNSKYGGYNLRLGALYRPISFVRLGLTLTTPTYITGTDKWRFNDTTIDDQDSVFTDGDAGEIKYKIRSPFSLAAGGAVNLTALMVSGSVEWTDWSQTRYLTEPPFTVTPDFDFDDERSLANDSLRSNYRNTLRLRLGAEFTLPILNLQVRGGYIFDPSQLKGFPDDDFTMPFIGALFNKKAADREFFTAGVGIFLDKQTRFDVALMHGEWTEYSTLDDFSDNIYSTSEKINYNKILASLAVRF
jgi:long-subunit fatty acid transport protein